MAGPTSMPDLQQEEQDGITALREEPAEIEDNALSEWDSLNLLSLDGGGIRGYWSLLALKWLMEWIAELEEEAETKLLHSFEPEPWPETILRPAPHTDENRARRYFPCHYFDYICGSSTGALIAIMLGRFRMTVADCISEYETLAEEVFGKPRIFTTLRFAFGNRTKYKAEYLKKVIQEVAKRRVEGGNDASQKVKFPYKRGLCKTFVTTLKTESDQKNVATLFLIRSYDHFPRTSHNHHQQGPHDQSRKSTGTSLIHPARAGTGLFDRLAPREEKKFKATRSINYGPAHDFEIWEVARAATAAPFYFDELEIQNLLFSDGGFNYTNNPTREGAKEIEEAYGPERIGAVVSIGTARHDKAPNGKGLLPIISRFKGFAQAISDPEVVHRDMETLSEDREFPYYRLNNPGALDIPLDEWVPKKSSPKKRSGSATMKAISDSFAKWTTNHRTHSLFKNCAAQLVERRRARAADTSRWERYATGASYKCRITGCDLDEFINCDEFKAHLIQKHKLPTVHLVAEINECRSSWQYRP